MKKLINSYSNDKIPEIVEVKWQDTLSAIKRGEVKRHSVKNTIPFVMAKFFASMAACFILLVSLSYANPVFAESIPFMSGIIGFLRNDEVTYNDEILQNTEVEEFMTPVDEENIAVNIEKIEKFEIKETFSDENLLVFTMAIPEIEEVKNMKNINAILDVYIDDVLVEENYYTNMTNTGGGFVSLVDVTVSEHTVNKTNYNLKIDVKSVQALGDTAYAEDYLDPETQEPAMSEAEYIDWVQETRNERERHEILYIVELLEIPLDGMQFETNVEIDKEQNTSYTVNFSENGCEITNVIASPINTYIEYSLPEDVYLFVTDNFGNELSNISQQNDRKLFYPLVAGTTSLNFKFVKASDVSKPLAEFEIEVAKGFITQQTYNYNYNFTVSETREITKVPDLGIPDYFENRFEDDVIAQFGETILIDSFMGTGQHEVTLSNLQIFDSLSDFGITLEQTAYADQDAYEGKKFVTIDVHVKNINATGVAYEGVGANAFGVQDFVKAQYRQTSAGFGVLYYEPIQYNNLANDTMKGYYFFDMGTNAEQSLTVGFFFDTKALENGELQFVYKMYDEDIGKYNTILNVPQSLINID